MNNNACASYLTCIDLIVEESGEVTEATDAAAALDAFYAAWKTKLNI